MAKEESSVTLGAYVGDVSIPESLRDVEAVRSCRTPIALKYDYVPGTTSQTYLTEMANKKIMGLKSPVDGAVYVPPRGVDPRHGAIMTEYVELAHTGHIGNFCITSLPIPGRTDLVLPYVSAWIHIDGADIGFMGLVQGIDANRVRIGMRVKAHWKPDDELGRTAENIMYWEPTGEPDVPVAEAGNHAWNVKQGGAEDA
jgi:uncharacterized OB-fold protein